MVRVKPAPASSPSSANLGFEARLRLTADKLRKNLNAAEYMRFVAGLNAQFDESAKSEKTIHANLNILGFKSKP
jgi:hypothetical protein